jgi:hypothetical protein
MDYQIAITINEYKKVIEGAIEERVTSAATKKEKVKSLKLAGEWVLVFQEKVNEYEDCRFKLKGKYLKS